tara:strand:+ start:1470 stop:2120 length:651 start_codon:yes stop_codon:yes gene_type:complete
MPVPRPSRLASWTLLAACVTPVAAIPVWEVALAAGSGGLALLLSFYALYVCRRTRKQSPPAAATPSTVDIEKGAKATKAHALPKQTPAKDKKPPQSLTAVRAKPARIAPQRSAPAGNKKRGGEAPSTKSKVVEIIVDLAEDAVGVTKSAASTVATKAKNAAGTAITKTKDVVSAVVGEANADVVADDVPAKSVRTGANPKNPLVVSQLGARKGRHV